MKPTFREILSDSHIPAIAVATLLVWSLESGIEALQHPATKAAGYLSYAIAIWGVPYSAPGLSPVERLRLEITLQYSCYTVIQLIAAWLISKWAYGAGPFTCLNAYWIRVNRRNRV